MFRIISTNTFLTSLETSCNGILLKLAISIDIKKRKRETSEKKAIRQCIETAQKQVWDQSKLQQFISCLLNVREELKKKIANFSFSP